MGYRIVKKASWGQPLVLALCAIAICGCAKTARPPVAESKTTADNAIKSVATTTEKAVEEAGQTPAAAAPEQPATEITPVALSQASAPPESKERILLLAPGGALIVDFVLTIEGRSHTEALARLVDEVLKIADTDGDGRTMWKELCACERIKYGQFGNLPIDGNNSEKQIIERYDIARDGVVDRSELPRFLTRNAGGSRPFSIRGTLDHRGMNRNLAPTWQILDQNRDSIIDANERESAVARLAAKDTDDDEIVTANEMKPPRDSPDPQMMTADRRRRGPDSARLLGEHADWFSVQQALEQTYAGGGKLRGGGSAFAISLFDELDANHDGRLVQSEIKRLNDVPAHLIVEVAFGATEGKKPHLRLRSVASIPAEESPTVAEQPGQLTISLNGSTIVFATNDTVATTEFVTRAKQALDMFDQNKDGYLERSELPESLQGQLGRFEAVDTDGDGKAYPQEIEAFLSQQQAGLRAQIHARATDTEDLLFDALDLNHDQRLDSREIQHTAERLKVLDINSDGNLAPDELPEVLTIVLARGSIETPDTTFAIPAAKSTETDKKAPRWFTAMDANQDGVISRREFLGTAEQFEHLDRDASGLLELPEVPSGE
jgi:Ca2+-binding EF-hand superfamily protein